MQSRYEEFRRRGAEVLAISSSGVEEHRSMATRKGLAFPILSDPRGESFRAYGLLDPGALPLLDTQVARPAEFLVDGSGTIRGRILTDNWRIRARPEDLLELGEKP